MYNTAHRIIMYFQNGPQNCLGWSLLVYTNLNRQNNINHCAKILVKTATILNYQLYYIDEYAYYIKYIWFL